MKIRLRKAKISLTYDQKYRLANLFRTANMSQTDFAKKHNLTPSIICRLLKWYRRESPVKSIDSRRKEIKELRAQGTTYQQIADKYNITRQRAHQLLHPGHKNNWERKNPEAVALSKLKRNAFGSVKQQASFAEHHSNLAIAELKRKVAAISTLCTSLKLRVKATVTWREI